MSDPIQSALEKFEAARLIYDAKYEYADEVCREIDAALAPAPQRTWAGDETLAQQTRCDWWRAQRRRQVVARLGTNKDDYIAPHRDRMERAEADLAAIEATSPAELLCQLQAWWSVEECIVDSASSEARMIMRLLQGLERLAKAA